MLFSDEITNSISEQNSNDESTKSLTEQISEKCENEDKAMERESSIKTTDPDSIVSFRDESFCNEMEKLCPTLTAAINGAIGRKEINNFGVKSTIYGILFKARFSLYSYFIA